MSQADPVEIALTDSPTETYQAWLASLHRVVVSAAAQRQDELPGLVNALQGRVVQTPGEASRPAYGWFAEYVWRCDERRARELFLDAGRERRPGLSEAESVLVTLLHGACHVWAQLHHIRDTSRQGRYYNHNGRFITIALTIGLAVEKDVSTGGRTLALSSWARIEYADLLAELEQGLMLIREPERISPR
jgi:hypothetical protein